ncbi:helix-turn-helix domain-containing protein [Bacillus thuringiensis]
MNNKKVLTAGELTVVEGIEVVVGSNNWIELTSHKVIKRTVNKFRHKLYNNVEPDDFESYLNFETAKLLANHYDFEINSNLEAYLQYCLNTKAYTFLASQDDKEVFFSELEAKARKNNEDVDIMEVFEDSGNTNDDSFERAEVKIIKEKLYPHLSDIQRLILHKIELDYRPKEIADELGKHHSFVPRELKKIQNISKTIKLSI